MLGTGYPVIIIIISKTYSLFVNTILDYQYVCTTVESPLLPDAIENDWDFVDNFD